MEGIQQIFNEINTKWKGFGVKVYRGESKKYETICYPSIWRNDSAYNTDKLKEPNIQGNILTRAEIKSISDFKNKYTEKYKKDYIFEELKERIEEDSIYWLCLAQHYRTYTRFVDVTFNILIALYFACSSNFDDNGFLYFIAKSSCIDLSKPNPGSYPKTIAEFFETDGNSERIMSVPFLFEPLIINERLKRQSGAFIWTKEIGVSCWKGGGKIEIQKNLKPIILDELEELGISKEYIYPNR